ncbi:hypothetical protein CCR75_006998 [Bremia lactucae]|uniref:carbonic anhydrase n=1 Tax=Bremia lactucae TaxID=4779 RepID=A0A976FRI4_BRELC|nr:hypothetical protein CCR75_006998 [Bremia lactucae]
MKFITIVTASIAASAPSVFAQKPSTAWGYHPNTPGMLGLENWANEWNSCGGVRQSPIDIVRTPSCSLNKKFPLQFSGSCSEFNLSEPHEPLQASAVGGDCSVSLNGADYSMLQFHLHAPSEHLVNGKSYDASIHFVHASSDAKALVVVGIFLEISQQSNPWLSPLLDALENVNSTQQTDAVVVQLESYSSLVLEASKGKGVYNYPGSLTTPGCDETADWWVVENPIQISAADFERLHKDLLEYEITNNGSNARPVQPLNQRTIAYYKI